MSVTVAYIWFFCTKGGDKMSSLENRVTLNTYLREATMCLALQLISDGKEGYTPPHQFIKRCFEPLGENARVLEIGAADGAFANDMRLGGLNIVVSEAVSSMRRYSSIPESEWILFNIIDDDFPDIFDGILAWRVFIHFSSKDLAISLDKSYRALNPGGRLVFNLYSNKAHPEYDGGAHDNSSSPTWAYSQRYYFSYSEEYIRELIEKTPFRVAHFHREGENDEWLVFVLEKPR